MIRGPARLLGRLTEELPAASYELPATSPSVRNPTAFGLAGGWQQAAGSSQHHNADSTRGDAVDPERCEPHSSEDTDQECDRPVSDNGSDGQSDDRRCRDAIAIRDGLGNGEQPCPGDYRDSEEECEPGGERSVIHENNVARQSKSPDVYLSPIPGPETTLAVKLATPSYSNPGDVSGQIFVTITLAAAIIYTIPPIVMFFLAQKNIMEGVVTTGLK